MFLRTVFLATLALHQSVSFSVNDLPRPFLSPIPNGGKLWVLLAAGSNGWYNYRHQADVCHAYQVVSNHGVPDENIVVMMYDDIAFNQENPTPGVIINHPNGSDVYNGVPKDYNCQNNNPQVFLDVLSGNKSIVVGSKKVIESGPNDYIFVYFTDHGARGLVGFGEQILKATDLNKVIKQMHDDKKFAKMVVYIEACESGSMFKGLLPDDIDVFATTASNSTSSSYACYYDIKRKTFLGDVYSIKWLEDSDKENLKKETLEQQYDIVKKETNTSMVMQFGDMDISKLSVGEFQGEQMSDVDPLPIPPSWLTCGATQVEGPEVPVEILTRRINNAESQEEVDLARAELDRILENRQFMMDKFTAVVGEVTQDDQLTNGVLGANHEVKDFDCYYAAVDEFHARCFNLGMNDFAMKHVYLLGNMCEMGYSAVDVVNAIKKHCTHPKVYGII